MKNDMQWDFRQCTTCVAYSVWHYIMLNRLDLIDSQSLALLHTHLSSLGNKLLLLTIFHSVIVYVLLFHLMVEILSN